MRAASKEFLVPGNHELQEKAEYGKGSEFDFYQDKRWSSGSLALKLKTLLISVFERKGSVSIEVSTSLCNLFKKKKNSMWNADNEISTSLLDQKVPG